MIEVPRLRSERFAPSLHEGLCGLENAIINSGSPAYVATFTTMASGQFLDAGREPEALGCGSPLKGEKSWSVNVARRLRGRVLSQSLLKAGQGGSGGDLSLFLVDVYRQAELKVDSGSKGKLLALLRLFDSDEPTRKKFIGEMIG